MSWVTERAKCNARSVFDELGDIIEQDVRKMEELRERNELGGSVLVRMTQNSFSLRLERGASLMNLCLETPGRLDGVVCQVFLNDGYVAIQPGYSEEVRKRDRITIQPDWNRESAQCQLSIQSPDGENTISLNQLGLFVQKFLEPLFFPPDPM